MYVWDWHFHHSCRGDRLHVPHLANKVCNCCLSTAWPTCHRDRQSEGQRSEPAAFYWLELVTWPLVLTCSDRGRYICFSLQSSLWVNSVYRSVFLHGRKMTWKQMWTSCVPDQSLTDPWSSWANMCASALSCTMTSRWTSSPSDAVNQNHWTSIPTSALYFKKRFFKKISGSIQVTFKRQHLWHNVDYIKKRFQKAVFTLIP